MYLGTLEWEAWLRNILMLHVTSLLGTCSAAALPIAPQTAKNRGCTLCWRANDDGSFFPKLGSKVIDFKDYHYSKDGPRIYNLPGRFVEKGKEHENEKGPC
jgi:hypothetical protein